MDEGSGVGRSWKNDDQDPGGIDLTLESLKIPAILTDLVSQKASSEAAQAFEGALKVNPQNVHVYNRLGIAYRKQGKYKEAIDQHKQALKIAPNDEHIYDNLGRALLEAAMRQDARRAFGSALKINPSFLEIKQILATL